MSTFLSIIGIFALIMIFKFIYDTYLTNNTEKDWQKYKQDYPEDAERIDKNKGLNFNTKLIQNNNLTNTSATIYDLPNDLLELHKENSFIEDFENKIRYYKNDNQENIDEYIKLKLFVNDKISKFLYELNMNYLLDKNYMSQYNKHLSNIIMKIKSNEFFYAKIFPYWFLSGYPDVTYWILSDNGSNFLPQNILEKIIKEKNKSAENVMQDLLNDLYEVNPSSDALKYEDYRLIIDIYKKNKKIKLENLGIT